MTVTEKTARKSALSLNVQRGQVVCRDCRFEGAGIRASGVHTQVQLTRSTLSGCIGHGLVVAHGASAEVSKCLITKCIGDGIGAESGQLGNQTRVTVRETEVSDCGRFGVRAYNSTVVEVLDGCTVARCESAFAEKSGKICGAGVDSSRLVKLKPIERPQHSLGRATAL